MDKKSRIYVAGHRGMVGSALLRKLQKEGFENIITRTSSELDLTRQYDVEKFFEENVTNRQNIDYIETPEFLHVEVWPRHKSCKDIVENEKAKSCLEQKLYEYFEKYIDRSFPRYMQKREEKLYVEIVIDHQGKLSRFKIVKSDNEKLSELTSKAFEKLIDKHGDEFISGKNNGRQVATKFYIPIKFSR